MKKRSQDDWFRPRPYLHFDKPLGFAGRPRVEQLVRNQDKVVSHSFFPFISYDRTKYKIVELDEDAGGGRYLDDTGVRTLSYAAHADAHLYSFYGQRLSQLYESRLNELGISDSVIAFRKLRGATDEAKSNIHFAHDAFQAISRAGNCIVYTFDVSSFFDNLDAQPLKQAWASLLGVDRLPHDHFAIFKSITAHSVVDRDALYLALGLPKDPPKDLRQVCDAETFRLRVRGDGAVKDAKTGHIKRGLITTKNRGIPQGSPISGLLANIYMMNFDHQLNERIKTVGGRYFRYCDDLFLLVPTAHDFDVGRTVSEALAEIGLELNQRKSERSAFGLSGDLQECDRPIQYLGFVFDGKQTCIRTSSLSRYLRKMKSAVKLARSTQRKYNVIRTKRGQQATPLHRKTLLKRFSHEGGSNFIRYGLRAARIMKSPSIKRQIKKMGRALAKELAAPPNGAN